jgi:hypothetical protein
VVTPDSFASAAVALDSLAASPSAEDRLRNSMQSSTASFRMESSRRQVTATAASESPCRLAARGYEALDDLPLPVLLVRCTEALDTAESMMSRSTTSRMRSSSETDAAGRAVGARQPPPRTRRGMHVAVAAFIVLVLMLQLVYDGVVAGFARVES